MGFFFGKATSMGFLVIKNAQNNFNALRLTIWFPQNRETCADSSIHADSFTTAFMNLREYSICLKKLVGRK